MVSFFIDIFGLRAFGAVPDKAEGLKLITVGFYRVVVVNMFWGFF